MLLRLWWLLVPIQLCILYLLHKSLKSGGHIGYAHQVTSPYDVAGGFDNFDNELGTPSGEYIVPNIVHFIRFGNKTLPFVDAICILAALKNQKPDKLVIHTDQTNLSWGRYWDTVVSHPLAQGVLKVKFLPQPSSIFGRQLSRGWRPFHAADIARLSVLMDEGGIFLDGDSYIVRSLNDFRRYEMTLGWQIEGGISNQVIIAHKNARFLSIWYQSYTHYKRNGWYYNAGDLPTIMLRKSPHLIHRVEKYLAEWVNTVPMIYLERSSDWKLHYALHLLINHQYMIPDNLSETATYPVIFDHENILNYEANIRDMALSVYPFEESAGSD